MNKLKKPPHRMYCAKSGMACLVYHYNGICPDVVDCEGCKAENSSLPTPPSGQTPQLPKPKRRKLNREKLLKLAKSIREDMAAGQTVGGEPLREKILNTKLTDHVVAGMPVRRVRSILGESEVDVIMALAATHTAKAVEAAFKEGCDAHNRAYSGKPVKHPVPCNDCGSDYWVDWTLPHAVFNAVCPGGSGYLCLPCFVKRMEAQNAQS